MLDYLRWRNFGTSATVGECMGDPSENWYRAAGGAPDASLTVNSTRSTIKTLNNSLITNAYS